jgi:ribosomal protein S27AE
MSFADVEESLRPYDPAGRCPKCGNDAVGTEYRSGKDSFGGLAAYRFADLPIERMQRKCLRCGNSWWEAPLDRQERKLGVGLASWPFDPNQSRLETP